MKKVLLTGHMGFIGSGLWKRLATKETYEPEYQLTGIDLKHSSDILHYQYNRFSPEEDIDLVIHLAAKAGVRESVENPKAYWETNVEGTRKILEAYPNTRVLVASSSSAHEPYLNPYAATKYITETIPHSNCCFMRFHTVYNDSARTGMFFDKLFKGEVEYITEHERDFIHLEDMLDAIEALIDNPQVKGTFDIGTGRTIKMNDILPNLPIKTDTPRERQRTCADTSFMKENCGWEAKIKIEDFLKEHNEVLCHYNNG